MRKCLVAVVLSLAMFCTACSTAWVSTLDSVLAAAAPAIINILQIVAISRGVPVNSAMVTKVNADAAAVRTLAADFAKTSAAAGPGVCQQLSAAVGVYGADVVDVMALAQVSDTVTQQKIVLLGGLVTSSIAAITAVIPACQNPVAGKMKVA